MALTLLPFSCQFDHQNNAQQIKSVLHANIFALQHAIPISLHFVQLDFVGHIHKL
jgi:hypothetical protein